MQNDILILFYKLSTSMIANVNNQLREFQLTFQQYIILLFIEDITDEIVGKDICQRFDLSHPTVVGLVYRMVKSDLITTKTSLKDRRQTSISISKHGQEVLNKARNAILELDNLGLTALDNDEEKLLIHLLLKINKTMKNEETE